MQELRWNPVLREWVGSATHRQDQPQLPRNWCPFCPGSGRVPDTYDVHLYANDFPAFALDAEEPAAEGGLYAKRSAVGACDVVLYHPDHNTVLERLPAEHIRKVIGLWKRRFAEMRGDPRIRYVFIFENRGEVIGVTMPHPHGQIYSFPYIPPRLERELESARLHREATGRCLFCDILAEERGEASAAEGTRLGSGAPLARGTRLGSGAPLARGTRLGSGARRIVEENERFTAFIPFFARWPYEVHIYSRRHLRTIEEFSAAEEDCLAVMLKRVLLRYDHLFNFAMPFIMVLHQSPVNGSSGEDLHFHIEFYPPYRSATKLKYLAGVESGAGTFLNDTAAEEKAAELRAASPEE